MKKKEDYKIVLWSIITLIGVLHLLIAVFRWDLVVESFSVPIWFSVVAFVVLGWLSYKLWWEL